MLIKFNKSHMMCTLCYKSYSVSTMETSKKFLACSSSTYTGESPCMLPEVILLTTLLLEAWRMVWDGNTCIVLLISDSIYCMYILLVYPGWPADLEFLETWKSQGILCHLKKVREFREIRKSQGILLVRNKYRRRFFKIHSSGK